MAPEMILNKKYDAKVDIWSVGIIAYVLLCGCVPFQGQSFGKVFQQIGFCLHATIYEI